MLGENSDPSESGPVQVMLNQQSSEFLGADNTVSSNILDGQRPVSDVPALQALCSGQLDSPSKVNYNL